MKFKDYTKDIDDPIKFPESWNFLKKNKIKISIIFEDGSYKDYFRKLKEDYTFTIKKRKYFIKPECIIHGKNPTFFYYFNNPMPISFKFERSKINQKDMTDKKVLEKLTDREQMIMAQTVIDASGLNVAFNSTLINKMYHESRLFTVRNVVIILAVVTIITLVILHFTGVINLFELLTGKQAGGG